MKTNSIHTDEYTALQKYISTYRDPKAVDAEANAAAEGKDAGKGKAWYQVCSTYPPSRRNLELGVLTRSLVLAVWYLQPCSPSG